MISIVIVIFKLYIYCILRGHPSGPQPVMEADILMIISMMNIVMIVTITDN